MKNNDFNILLTSVGRRTYMIDYFKQALKGMGFVHASNSVMTYSMSKADKCVLTPNIYDENYIDFLLKYCIQEKITAIISLFDIDLFVLAKNKRLFGDNGIRVIVSDPNVIEICNDKWSTYETLRSLNILTPKSFLDINQVISSLKNREIKFPVVVKPRWGMGSIGVYIAESFEELEVFYKKIKNTIFNTYLKYESSIDVDHCVIFQEKIIGKEYGIDILDDLEGNYVTTIAKEKLALRAGETDIAKIVDCKKFESVAKLISHELRHIANMDVDCFLTDSGDMYVLELNCRFGGQYPFSHNAGVNFPQQIINWVLGLNTDFKLLKPKIGVISCKDLVPVVCNF